MFQILFCQKNTIKSKAANGNKRTTRTKLAPEMWAGVGFEVGDGVGLGADVGVGFDVGDGAGVGVGFDVGEGVVDWAHI